MTLDVENKIFVIHMAIQKQEKMVINSIKKAQIRALLFDKAPIAVLAEYSNYTNIFLAKNIVGLLKYNGINDYTIKLKKDKQLFFVPIYSLKLIKLEIFKTYIKINLANSFIWPFKLLAFVSILFD